MPHFVVDCSRDILQHIAEEGVIARLHRVAHSTGLFEEGDIKVRVRPSAIFSVGGRQEDFVHVFASIMEGRGTQEKADLSRRMVSELVAMFPHVPNIAMNVAEFEKATYCNRTML